MDKRLYINVILPLKLGWEPFYALPQDVSVEVGDRVLAPFAGKPYLGVVSAVDSQPGPEIRQIKEIYGKQEHKDKISLYEIEFWRMLASYYMCSIGEVYKAAYPSVKDETVRPRKKDAVFLEPAERAYDMPDQAKEICKQLIHSKKPILLSTPWDKSIMQNRCLQTIKDGGNVLWLVPEVKMTKALEEEMRKLAGSRLIVWGSNISPSRKREAARTIRSGKPYVVLGTRSSIFLPFKDLKLVIVQEEHELSYKQSSPAPRYNGRDAAVMLAKVHGSDIILESPDPSFESCFNALGGKYESHIKRLASDMEWEIVDIGAEIHKNGMVGDVPKRLLERIRRNKGAKIAIYKPFKAAFPKAEELSSIFNKELGYCPFITEDLIAKPIPEGMELLAVFGSDAMLGKNGFRSDENLIHTVMAAVIQAGPSLRSVFIPAKASGHPVFGALVSGNISPLLSERRQFGYPPFTRMVDINAKDNFPDRAARMTASLRSDIEALSLCQIIPNGSDSLRLFFSKDKTLTTRKEMLLSLVAEFEKNNKYTGHIFFDPDPL